MLTTVRVSALLGVALAVRGVGALLSLAVGAVGVSISGSSAVAGNEKGEGERWTVLSVGGLSAEQGPPF